MTIGFSLLAALILFALQFLWHLHLAPTEIVLDRMEPIFESVSVIGVAKAPNYDIWKHRQRYTAIEFASLLAGLDPSGSAPTTDFKSYTQLVIEALLEGSLKYVPPYGMTVEQFNSHWCTNGAKR